MGPEGGKGIPSVLSGRVVVCQEDNAAATGLRGGTWHAVAAGPIPHADVGLWEQGEQTRG